MYAAFRLCYLHIILTNPQFRDELVQAGVEGGHQAAQKLQANLEEYHKVLLGTQTHRKIVVRIYVNLHGLTGAYMKARIVTEPRTVRDFVIGFNRELPFVEIVDVGDDKEAADNKIRENLALFWSNDHCKHITLAGSADRGYVSFLRQYCTTDEGPVRLTLIESVPFPPAFEQLAARFQTTKFRDVFRDTKITPEECLPPPKLDMPLATRTTNGRSSYATASALSTPVAIAPPKISNAPSIDMRPSQPKGPKQRKMYFNKRGERIDESLPKFDMALVNEMSGLKLCNRHFLTKCDDSYCPYEHEGELSGEEKRALARVARFSKCANGLECDDRDCVAAHQCTFDTRCVYKGDCKYGPEMHNVDKTVAETR